MKSKTEQSNETHSEHGHFLQHTIARPVSITGKGLLLGREVAVQIEPAQAGEGIIFERTDFEPPVRIPATIDYATNRARRTTLSHGEVSIENMLIIDARISDYVLPAMIAKTVL